MAARSHADPAGLGELVLRRVGGHAFEGCVEQLARAIRLGVYPHGSMLPSERELAGRMGVSRATVREAIAALRQAGMVSTQRGRGGGTAVVFQPPAPAVAEGDLQPSGDQLDCLAFRRVVEPGACWVAATRTLSPDQEALLTNATDEVAAADDPAAHRQADSRLHLAIASVTESPRIVAAVTDVQACVHEMLQRIPVLQVNIDHSNAQHRVIVSAILAGQPARARRAMEQHCDDTAALVRGLLG